LGGGAKACHESKAKEGGFKSFFHYFISNKNAQRKGLWGRIRCIHCLLVQHRLIPGKRKYGFYVALILVFGILVTFSAVIRGIGAFLMQLSLNVLTDL
jgi:hypothetical protein